MRDMVVSIIGLGLIGGSIAKDLMQGDLFVHVIGVDNNQDHANKALELKLVNELSDLEIALKMSDLIILAVPVDAAEKLVVKILDSVHHPVVMDVGSTKSGILDAVKDHTNRDNYVATHPMSGTEDSGPEAAIANLFKDKLAIICDAENSNKKSLSLVKKVYDHLGSKIKFMNPVEHDASAAYVSHISHISSFALALTVLETEKNKDNIRLMASGGFRTTVRLANSNEKTWAPIFLENKENMLEVLTGFIDHMNRFKSAIENNDNKALNKMMQNANKVKEIIN
jgi:prephenate dehydrogenase